MVYWSTPLRTYMNNQTAFDARHRVSLARSGSLVPGEYTAEYLAELRHQIQHWLTEIVECQMVLERANRLFSTEKTS